MSVQRTIDPALLRPAAGAQRPGSPSTARRPAAGGFDNALADQVGRSERLQFSKHALARLQRRDMAPSADQVARLSDAVTLAAAKGSRSALVLVDDLAFVTAPHSRTVVTAMAREHMREQVFTNIDTAVIR